MTNLHWLDTLMLLVYFGGMAGMAAWFARKNTSTEEYFVGGRSFPGWAIGLSMVGTSISSVTFLAYPADAYKTAWLRYVPNFALPVGVAVASLFFLPFFRRTKTTSAYEYLEGRFGPSVRVYAAIAYIVAQLVRVSTILYLVSLLIHEFTELDTTYCIILGGTFVALYTIIGGIDAVVWTDVIQTVVLVVGGVLCLAVIVTKLPGGLGQIFEVAGAAGKLGFADLEDGVLQPAPWGLSLQKKTVLMMFFLGLTNWLREYSAGQHVVQRYVASKSAREARKAMWICVASSLPIWAFYMFLGTSLFVFFKVFPCQDATEMLNGTQKAEQILPFFVINYLPPGATGLVIAAALAAAMSSLDSSINSISTVSVVDIYRRLIARDRDDRHYLHIAWAVACVTGVLMIGGATILDRVRTTTLQDTSTILVSLLGGGLLGTYLLGFFTNRGDARAVWTGVVFTMVFTAWTVVAKHWPDALPSRLRVPFDLYYAGFIGNVLMFLVGFGASFLFGPISRSLRNLTVWQSDSTPVE